MESILHWGVETIVWLQQFSPQLDLPFKTLTFLGNEEFFMLILPFVYWSVDRRTGARLAILFLFSAYVNTVAKALAGQPRPFQYDKAVQPLIRAGGGGFPSGHTQSAVVIWGYLAAAFRRPWLWVAAGALIVLIPLSRVYLGVHFPTDLLGGYLIGTALLLLYLRLEPGVEAWLSKRGLPMQLFLALALPALLLLLFVAKEKYVISSAAALMGTGLGLVLERRWVGFDAGGGMVMRALRFILGTAILFALQAGLKAAFSGLDPEFLFRFIRYVLIGLWIALGGPWLFLRLKMAGPDRRP
ncbi:MAG: phosphatase PAP2 family protein [Deltaproteobacteria bacterium]|nr:phosphatase PAP2 family protein [Deltaproteobacteria bacterium]